MRQARQPHPYAQRRRRLCRRFEDERLDALLVTSPFDVRYLSGFTGEDSYLLIGRSWAVLLTDSRFAEQAKVDCPDIEHYIRTGSMAVAAAAALRGRKARRVGLQSDHVSLALEAKLSEHINPRRLRPTDNLIASLRATKDAAELDAIRKAARIAERAFKGLTGRGAKGFVGRTEADLAGELEYRMRKLGASGASFPSIVAAGAHAALPHYRPGSTKVRPGHAVLLDWGAVYDGYCSDLTRVVFAGRIPPQIGRIYEVVLEAQLAGIRAVRSGREPKVVDAAAREVIAAAGFGDHFGHGLGHGVGLEVHEGPTVSARGEGRLRAGNVITVEPGIYIPGVGGVRIEDDVVVERGGGRVLTNLPKRLQAMVLK